MGNRTVSASLLQAFLTILASSVHFAQLNPEYAFYCNNNSYTVQFKNVVLQGITLLTDTRNCGGSCLAILQSARLFVNRLDINLTVTPVDKSRYRLLFPVRQRVSAVHEITIETTVNICWIEITSCEEAKGTFNSCQKNDCFSVVSCKGNKVSCPKMTCLVDSNDKQPHTQLSHYVELDLKTDLNRTFLDGDVNTCENYTQPKFTFKVIPDNQVPIQKVLILASYPKHASDTSYASVSVFSEQGGPSWCKTILVPVQTGFVDISECLNSTKLLKITLTVPSRMEYSICDVRFLGCEDNSYGFQCRHRCSCRDEHENCDRITGRCWKSGCRKGFNGTDCTNSCNGTGRYGYNCQEVCGKCLGGDSDCNGVTGVCGSGCLLPWTGLLCNSKEICADCPGGNKTFVCSPETCPSGCSPFYSDHPCYALVPHTTECRTLHVLIDRVCIQECRKGIFGENCSSQCTGCQENDCDVVTGKCKYGCGPGYEGDFCHTPCAQGTYGNGCSFSCGFCINGSGCHPENGYCFGGCQPGWKGSLCKQECQLGKEYGANCSGKCGNCVNRNCSVTDGSCLEGCNVGSDGRLCAPCRDNTYGVDCTHRCGHCQQTPCHHVTGECPQALCQPGYMGDECKTTCLPNHYGAGCSRKCRTCQNGVSCDPFNGFCPTGCPPGLKPPLCQASCDSGTYGNCSVICGQCNGTCDPVTGVCPAGCLAGYTNPQCTDPCPDGQYGPGCRQRCPNCLGNATCNKTSGECPRTCLFGYSSADSKRCKIPCKIRGFFGLDCSQKCGNCLLGKDDCDVVTGKCNTEICEPGYWTPYCNMTCPTNRYGFNCSGKCGDNCVGGCHPRTGVCRTECKNGWQGNYCNESCHEGYFGASCTSRCGYCLNDSCDAIDGLCSEGCHPGYTGSHCKDRCPKGTFGDNCTGVCGHCEGGCDFATGKCSVCKPGYRGAYCKEKCGVNTYGNNCSNACGKCKAGESCNHLDGKCNACEPGYMPWLCQEKCDPGFFGQNCDHRCGHCWKGNHTCNFETGHCQFGCNKGYTGDTCKIACSIGTFGAGCSSACGQCARREPCNIVDGTCAGGCEPGYLGDQCLEKCPAGMYGSSCSEHCGACEGGSRFCQLSNGVCANGCMPGFLGDTCNHSCPDGTFGRLCQETCGQCREGVCRTSDGMCKSGCMDHWAGPRCKTDCRGSSPDEQNCTQYNCSACISTGRCVIRNGKCQVEECQLGMMPPDCKQPCPDGQYSYNCSRSCANCIPGRKKPICLPTNGECTGGCLPGWQGQLCDDLCPDGSYGLNCTGQCGNCWGGDLECNKVNGTCTSGCREEFMGDKCDILPKAINLSCMNCFGGPDECTQGTYVCQRGCVRGWLGSTCTRQDTSLLLDSSAWVVQHGPEQELIIAGMALTLIYISVVCGFCIYVSAVRNMSFFDKYDFGSGTQQHRPSRPTLLRLESRPHNP